MRLATASMLLFAACGRPAADQAASAPPATPAAAAAAAAPARPALEPALARAIAATQPFEVEGRPCLARPGSWPPSLSAEERSRQHEIRSDSHWLNRFVRERYGERLAYSGLERRGGRWVHIVALTGSKPIPPLGLGDGAAGVPVEIVYDAPWSFEEVMRRRAAGNPVMIRLVPDAQGEGFAEGPDGGWISLDVYSPGARPREDVLAHCDALRRAYRLPVLIQFIGARAMLQ